MNTVNVAGSWSETKAKIKARWSRLVESEIEGFKGQPEQLKDYIQKVYGYSRDQVDQEFNDFKASHQSQLEGLDEVAAQPSTLRARDQVDDTDMSRAV